MRKKRVSLRGFQKVGLVSILVIAGFLRLAGLDETHPGLQQDEAANAWNARCLLETGKDQVGASWPIFYIRALGENRTTPHVYLIAAFQALGGMNVWTTRLPIALLGVLTVLLIYYVGKRMFGVAVGLVGGGMLALNPWDVLAVRQAIQVGLVPFIVTGVMAGMLWARLPLTDGEERPRPLLAGLGGLVAGAGCYGYFAVRMFLPVFLFGIVLVTLRGWLRLLKSRSGILAVVAFVLGFAVVFGPLGWRHVTDPEMSKRGQSIWAWSENDSTVTKLGKVLGRYPEHFGPTFLFLKGDPAINHSVPGWGQFHWYALPVMLAGLVTVFRRVRRSPAARILLVWVILYPIGDLLTGNYDEGSHAFRSLPGLCGLVLLGSVGAVAAGGWLWRRRRRIFLVAACAMGIAVVTLNALLWYGYFGNYRHLSETRRVFHVELQEACEWLHPRVDQYDAVFCTTYGMNQPYIMMLVHLRYDPQKWHTDEKIVNRTGNWDTYFRFGKFHFLYGRYATVAIKHFTDNRRRDRVAFIIRPGEFRSVKPAHIIYRPDGKEVLWVCEADI